MDETSTDRAVRRALTVTTVMMWMIVAPLVVGFVLVAVGLGIFLF